jgi:chorismate mutase
VVDEIRVRAARGAIRVDQDTASRVLSATERLLGQLLERNEVASDDIVSAFFTVTDDLRSAFPAEAARRMGLGRVPLLCAQEIPVQGSMRGVIRVLLQFHTPRAPAEVEHVYLDGAETLRDDLG